MYLLIVLVVISIVYSPWFVIGGTLSGGDWPYLFLQNIQAFKIPTEPPFLWLDSYYQLTAKLGVQFFSFSWESTERIFWFLPFLIISFLSSHFFLKYLSQQLRINNKKSNIFVSLGCLIFMTNTYILMLVGGGQMGVVMAYSLTPAVLWRVFATINNLKFGKKSLILSSLILSIQLMFDPRIFLLSIFISFLYILFIFENFNIKILKRIILILGLSVVANLFWIFPNLYYFNTYYSFGVDAVSASFLSFATFSNSISLLHPNWPENIFGKTGFMKSEFIVLPILAFISLFFSNKRRTILFFAFLGFFGAFFAKGTNPPFGEIYIWLSNIPGFSIFRDPTKFYTMIIVSYMVLLPYSLIKLFEKVSGIRYYVLGIFAVIFLSYWLFLIRPAVFGQLAGTFRPSIVPKEYVSLRNFLITQPKSTKTLWVPRVQRFGFNSKTMPALSLIDVLEVSSASGVLDEFDTKEVKKQLMDEKVMYVIVPYDVLSEIFLTDRKYDDKLYTEAIKKMKNTSWLSELENNEFGKIKVFKVSY